MFFQAEDGRRDIGVTGVQTCALPIYVSLKVESGQFAALVGPTGAGKSTLLGLIARLYDPLSGAVKIDGADVRRFTLESLRRQVSFVLQETVLFRAPVWQNIAYGKPGASREEIVRAEIGRASCR